MNNIKKCLLTLFVVSILGVVCSLSAFAVEPSNIDYTCQVNGVNTIPPINYTSYPSYECFVVFTQNSTGYGYWYEFYVPRDDAIQWHLGIIPWSSGNTPGIEFYVFGSNISSTNYSVPEGYYYEYDETGTLITNGNLNRGSSRTIRPFASAGNRPTTAYYLDTTGGSSACISWFGSFFVGTVNDGAYYSTFTTGNPVTSWSFTINGASVSEPSSPGDSGGSGGGSGDSGVIDYTQYLLDIIDLLEDSNDKLDSIISILQNNPNQVVVDAIEDATDEVINYAPSNTTVPDLSIDTDDDTFPETEFDSDDLDELGIMSGGSALTWFYARLDDLATGNIKVLALITSALSLGFIMLVLNKRS